MSYLPLLTMLILVLLLDPFVQGATNFVEIAPQHYDCRQQQVWNDKHLQQNVSYFFYNTTVATSRNITNNNLTTTILATWGTEPIYFVQLQENVRTPLQIQALSITIGADVLHGMSQLERQDLFLLFSRKLMVQPIIKTLGTEHTIQVTEFKTWNNKHRTLTNFDPRGDGRSPDGGIRPPISANTLLLLVVRSNPSITIGMAVLSSTFAHLQDCSNWKRREYPSFNYIWLVPMGVVGIVLLFVIALFTLHLTCLVHTFMRANQQAQQQQQQAAQQVCSPEDREMV